MVVVVVVGVGVGVGVWGWGGVGDGDVCNEGGGRVDSRGGVGVEEGKGGK